LCFKPLPKASPGLDRFLGLSMPKSATREFEAALGRSFFALFAVARIADGADVLEYLSEIPLAGRTLMPQPARNTNGSSQTAPLGFVAGAENRLVASTVNQLMRVDSRASAAKLLSLFGPSGTGKTHLSRGLVHHWNDQRGSQSALYLTAIDFYRQLLDAVKRGAVSDYRNVLRAHELLAIDDLHQLPKYDYVSQELRSTLDHFEENGKTLIVTSRRPANLLANISASVRSRLSSGLLLQLSPPGKAARVRIIRRAAETLGTPLTDEAAKHIAIGIRGNANHLFGAVFELCAKSPKQTNGESECDLTVVASRTHQPPNIREILVLVAKTYGVPQAQLRSQSRRQSIVGARAMVAYLARELAGMSYEQIGRALGGRDHTTIIHSYRRIDRDRDRDPVLQEEIDELSRILLSS
jgi:chromosomal replication initiator protein